MLEALERLGIQQAHLGLADDLDREVVEPILRSRRLSVRVHEGAAPALAASRCALVGAGTATLDAAFAARPMVVLGKVHPLTAPIARRLIGAEFIGLPNLVMGREVFPECVQDACTAQSVGVALEGVMGAEWGDTLARLRSTLAGPAWPDTINARLNAVISNGSED